MLNDLNSLLGLIEGNFPLFFLLLIIQGFQVFWKQSVMFLHENSEFSLLQGKMSCPTFCVISACSLPRNRRVYNNYQLKCPQSLHVLTLSSCISELLAICVYNISSVQNVNTFEVQKFHPSCQTGSLKASCKPSEIW